MQQTDSTLPPPIIITDMAELAPSLFGLGTGLNLL